MIGIFKKILNLIFPPKCIFCGSFIDIDNYINICNICYLKIPFSNKGLEDLSHDYPYKNLNLKLICLCNYEGIIKQALIRYKFMNKPSYNHAFAYLLAEKLKKMTNCRKFDMILSIPLHKGKESKRGYNQAYLISKEISKYMKIIEASRLIKRVKNTKSQSKLDKNDRISNISGAFKINDINKVKDKTILLVDDIATTGATMGEGCLSLLEAGAKEIICAVIASGRKY